jgi:membrane protein implicated in regulation of membrane protease activity
VRQEAAHPAVHFEPLRPASRKRLIAGLVFGPLLWLVALSVASWVLEYTWAIELGLVVTLAAFLVAIVVLTFLHRGRRRQEERYQDAQHEEERYAVGG